MSNGTPKVYVIKTPGNTEPPAPDLPTSPSSEKESQKSQSRSRSGRAGRSDNSQPLGPAGKKALVLAYLAGPVTIARWLKGRSGLLWSAAGSGSVLIGFILLLMSRRFDAWVETTSFGLMWWLLMVPTLVVLIGLVWARSVAAAGCMHRVPYSRLPRRLRSSAVVTAAGLLVPGLGMMLVGRPRHAGWSFALVAPLAAAGVIFARWHWLWHRARTPIPAGVSGSTLEIILAGTVALATVAAILWIVQALDGARRVSSSRSLVVADTASVALLVSLAVFSFAFRPTTLARNLHATAVTLRLDGYRLIPLALSETTTRLDPASPTYLAETAELYDLMGKPEKTRQKRRILEERANEYNRLAYGIQTASSALNSASYQSPYVQEDYSPYNLLPRLQQSSEPRSSPSGSER
jgi:hypothetical protein